MLNPVKNNPVVLIDEGRSKKLLKEKSFTPTEEPGIEVSIGQPLLNTATYSKPHVPISSKDEFSFNKRLEDFFEPLRIFVDKLISIQDNLLKNVPVKYPQAINQEQSTEAEELTSGNGDLGIDKTAGRIVEFAKAISGGDKTKVINLKEAIDQSFKEAEEILGELPEISVKTHDEVFKRLDEWEKS